LIKSASRVSGLIFAPTSIISEPIITVAPSKNGTKSPLFDSKLTAIRGAQEPKSSPPLYANPLALFRISVENRSDKNAGIGPNPDVATMIKSIVKIILSTNVVALTNPYNIGIASIAAADAKEKKKRQTTLLNYLKRL